jgi:Ca2+-binding EF-hand superfamily protein
MIGTTNQSEGDIMTQTSNELSVIRKQKLAHLFRLIDNTDNGSVDHKDLKNLIDRIAFARKLNNPAFNRALLEEKLTLLWQTLIKMGDMDFNGRLTREEWLKFFEYGMSEPVFYEGIIRPIESALIDIIDTNGDGTITYSDYRDMVLAWNVNEDELSHLFRKIDLNRNGHINREEADKAIREFFTSDEDVPGNWFFGDYTNA